MSNEDKHKDNKRKAALKKMRLVQTEEELPPENNVDSPIIASIVGGCWSDPGDTAGCSSYVTVTDHGLALLQPPVLSDEELDFEPVEDVKTLHKKYLQVEISDRKQEMAYRALKMCKVEKEIQLLDWKLDASMIF